MCNSILLWFERLLGCAPRDALFHSPPPACTHRVPRRPRHCRFLCLRSKVVGDNEACYSLIGRRYVGSTTKRENLRRLILPWQRLGPVRVEEHVRCPFEVRGAIKKARAAQKASAPFVNLGSSSSIHSPLYSFVRDACVFRWQARSRRGRPPSLPPSPIVPLSLSLSPMIRSFMRQ